MRDRQWVAQSPEMMCGRELAWHNSTIATADSQNELVELWDAHTGLYLTRFQSENYFEGKIIILVLYLLLLLFRITHPF